MQVQVQVQVQENTTDGSQWIVQVQPTERRHFPEPWGGNSAQSVKGW